MIKDRTDYIKDVNKDKNVQSDFVMILLNLSAIPDEVFQQLNTGVNNPAFQEEFLAAFERYRKKFERRFGVKWEYQNQQNVRRYIAYKRKKQGHVEVGAKDGKDFPRTNSGGDETLFSDFSNNAFTMD